VKRRAMEKDIMVLEIFRRNRDLDEIRDYEIRDLDEI
jgi:hypothetical protein